VGDQIFIDCTTKDLERLQPLSNRLMVAYQAMQVEVTKDLEPRDQMIVLIASLNQLAAVAEKAAKQSSTNRFVRTIKTAVKIGRLFGTGNIRSEQ
jgi:hypothetical protein